MGVPARKTMLLVLLCTAQFVLVVDVTIVTVSLRPIRDALHVPSQDLQWVITAYGLTFGGFLLLGGRCADLFGRRRLFLAGATMFMLSSSVCAAAQGPGMLITARAAQGLGAALVSPAALSLLTATFVDRRERNMALGVWAAVGSSGAAAGNIAGGVLTSLAGWRWIFVVNVPVCLVVLGAGVVIIPPSGARRAERVDLIGALTATGGFGLLIYGLSESPTAELLSAMAGLPILAGVVLIVGFVIVQQRSSSPLVPFRIFRSRATAGFVCVLLVALVSPSPYYLSSIYLQDALHFSPLRSGFAFAPWAALIGVSAQVAARTTSRLGPRRIVTIGFLTCGCGMYMLSRVDTSGSYSASLLPAFLLLGLGAGSTTLCSTAVAVGDARSNDYGVVAAIVSSAQQMGFAVGLSATVAISVARSQHQLLGGASASAAEVAGMRLALGIVAVTAIASAVVACVIMPSRAHRDLASLPVETIAREPAVEASGTMD